MTYANEMLAKLEALEKVMANMLDDSIVSKSDNSMVLKLSEAEWKATREAIQDAMERLNADLSNEIEPDRNN